MKNIILLTSFVLFLAVSNFYSQQQPFNLKKLNNVSVEIQDSEHLLSNTTSEKLLAEIKLHLLSADIKVVSLEDSKAQMVVKINYIRSTFAEQRVLVQLDIYEKVNTKRSGNIETEAITYNNFSLFKTKKVEQGIYDVTMDKLLIKFINDYINQNGS